MSNKANRIDIQITKKDHSYCEIYLKNIKLQKTYHKTTKNSIHISNAWNGAGEKRKYPNYYRCTSPTSTYFIFCEDNFLKRNIKSRKQKSNEDFKLAVLWVFCIHVVVSKSSQKSSVKLKYSSLITLEVHPFYVCACMHVHADTHTH